MRSVLIAAALAAGALAVPYMKEERALVTDTKVDVVYVTAVTTVTVQGPAPTEGTGTQQKWNFNHFRHGHAHNGGGQPAQPPAAPSTTTEEETAPTQQAPPSSPPSAGGSGGSTGGSGTSPPATGGSAAPPSGYAEVVVNSHNIHRKNHSASDIAWDDSLAASAATIAASCIYAHNVNVAGGGYGQNIAAGVSAANIDQVITNLFYNGEVNWYSGLYGEAQPSMTNFEHWGHFTQIVWKATTHVGCATQDCSGQGLANVGGDVNPFFTVCNYKSPGNFANEYGANVGEPLGEPSVVI